MSAIKLDSCVSRRPFLHLGLCTFTMPMGFLPELQTVSLNHFRRFNQCYLHTARKIAVIWTTQVQILLIGEILFANQCKVKKIDMPVIDKKIPCVAEYKAEEKIAICISNIGLECN